MAEIIFGIHAIEAKLRKDADAVFEILVARQRTDQRTKTIEQLARAAGIPFVPASQDDLDRLAEGANHQGIVARCQATRQVVHDEAFLQQLLDDIDEPAFLLVLDGVQDPHNLGACLRSADAAGVHAVIAPKDRAVGLTPVVRKIACGAAETVPFIPVTNLARTLTWLKDRGVWLTVTAANAPQTIYEIDFTGNCAIVIGAEGDGVRKLTRETCDFEAQIPMRGSVESLNASVATAICLFEVVRQRQGFKK